MPHLVEVAFKGNRKEFFAWSADDPPATGTAVIVEGDRGEDLGRVHATGALAAARYAGVAHGALALVVDSGSASESATAVVGEAAPAKHVLRTAAPDDVASANELPALDEQARRTALARVRAHGLAMKVTDAEWQWDRRKLTLYFTAEKRVDFRALVRDLAGIFRARIELKQIGVRDEAKRLTGIGRCGREYCSATWLPELRPVNLNVAKDQRLSLNPTQISGACGRLMCSLRYEHEFYVQQRKRFPREGRVLATSRGEEKVLASDIFRERVTLRGLDGETRIVPLDELRREVAEAAAGSDAAEPEIQAGDVPADDVLTGDMLLTDAGVVEDAPSVHVRVVDRPLGDAPRSQPSAVDVRIETVVEIVAPPDPPASSESASDVSTPDVSTPDVSTPDVGTPDVTPPSDRASDASTRRRGRRGGRRGRTRRDDA